MILPDKGKGNSSSQGCESKTWDAVTLKNNLVSHISLSAGLYKNRLWSWNTSNATAEYALNNFIQSGKDSINYWFFVEIFNLYNLY